MTSQEIVELLEEIDRPLSRKEIMDILKYENPSRVTHCLARLIKSKEIDFIWISCQEARKRDNSNKTNRRLRVYFPKWETKRKKK